MKQITIAGNVSKEGVARRTQAGEPVMGFSVAVNDMRTKKAVFFDCSMWGKRGDAIVKFLQKGTKVCVSGDLGIREHEGRTYLTINANEVTLMGDGKKKETDSYGNDGSDTDSIPF